jgi:hypothetical protein
MKTPLIGTLTLVFATAAFVHSSSALDHSTGVRTGNAVELIGWGDKGYGDSGSSGSGYGGGQDNDSGGWSGGNQKQQKDYGGDDNEYKPKKQQKDYGDDYKTNKGKDSGYGGNDSGGNSSSGSSSSGSGSSGSGSSGSGSSSSSGGKSDNSACLARCKEDCKQDAIANHKFQIDPTCIKNCNPRCGS